MKLKRAAARGATVLALAATGVFIATGSAFAGTVEVYTTDGDPGGEAIYDNSAGIFTVCDIEADGFSAYGQFSYGTLRQYLSGITDSSGSGTCVSQYTPNLVTGVTYYLQVCLKKDGALSYCRTESFKE